MEERIRLFLREGEKNTIETEFGSEKKQRVIERFIRMSRILEHTGADVETNKDIETALRDMLPEEKALRMYESIVAYSLEKRAEEDTPAEEKSAPDPYFISEFKQLWDDESARRIFFEKFGETRIDLAAYRLSGLGSDLRNIARALEAARSAYAARKQDLNLHRIENPTAIKAAKAKLAYQQKKIEELSNDENRIVNLEGYEHTEENTDVAAFVMYETLRRYGREAEAGFAWLPSRQEIHKKITDVIEHTGKAPLLIGPPGTGKTTQMDAAAYERTGTGAIRIPCHPGLSEEGLIYIRDIKAGEGAYDYTGTVTEAATGYAHSKATVPSISHGRVALLDEISQLNIDRALGPVKDIRQAKVGKTFSRFAPHAVLPGFQLAGTSNVPITDERLDREFSRIATNYFEMSSENPELYEFMLAKLLRREGYFPLVDKRDLAPMYQRHDIPEDKRTRLGDGSIVVAFEMLVEDPTDARHGFLYRFAGTIRTIQNSYIHGSKFNEKHLANTAVYEDRDSDGNIVIKGYVTDLTDTSKFPGGQMLKLKSGSSTITAEMISKWTEGFTQSGEKDMIRWLQQMLQEHIGQTSPEDAERIKAIADYFHVFEAVKRAGSIEPLTPKNIGYLSPRVPRPFHVERPQKTEAVAEVAGVKRATAERYETRQVLLDTSERVLIESGVDFTGGVGGSMHVRFGERFIVQDKVFVFTGVVAEEKSPYAGKLVGKFAREGLYRTFTPEEVDAGVLTSFQESLSSDFAALEENLEYLRSEDAAGGSARTPFFKKQKKRSFFGRRGT